MKEEDLNDFSDIEEQETDNYDDLNTNNPAEEDSLFSDDFGNDFIGEGGQTPMEKHQDLLKNLTNFAPYLRDTVNNWLGLVWDEDKEKYVSSEYITPIMNMKGAMWCVGVLKTYTRENNIITDISSEQYKYIILDLIDNIWCNLGTRTEEFGIKQDGDIIRIANEIQHAAELALMGAGDGKYNKFLGTTYSHTTSGQIIPGMNQNQPFGIMQQQQPKQKGIRARFRRMLLGE